ncbi:MAG: vWA domain-containing protein, partial [Terriglobales bacterium]
MDFNLPLSVMAQFDRKLARTTGDAYNFLVITATAPPALVAHNPGPLNLAIVIDVSDSMGGKPLNAAKQAAVGVVNALGDDDRLSLVSFADDEVLHFEALAMNNNGKKKAVREIERLSVRGNTNLSAGWLGGSRCVAKAMQDNPSYRNHVLVLSDGFANLGIINPESLAKH